MYDIGMRARFSRMEKNGKYFFLAMDQGIEHGPADFNDKNIDPDYVLSCAEKMKLSGMILQKGIAQKYWFNYSGKVPLIVKLNGKTNLFDGASPFSPQLCSIKEAISMGADAVGYTIYAGSEYEAKGFEQAGKIMHEAHDYGIPFILWSYPRGPTIKNDLDPKLVAHAARSGAEIGADIVKVKYTGDPKSFNWVVSAGGKTKVVAAGGVKQEGEEFLRTVRSIMDSGSYGLAIGRNVWQHEDPVRIANATSSIVFDNVSADEAIKRYKHK
jgi:fructose-bisphosphate aldolase, class I